MLCGMTLAHRLKPAHLRLILKIAETGKLQTAATSLAMSQPAASRMLSEIETLADAELFERHAKGMTPTLAGAAFVRHARVIVQGFDRLDLEVSDLKSGRGGMVRIGSVTGPVAGSLVPAIRQVKTRAPTIEITIEVAPSVSLVRGLVEGNFDFIIARLPPDADSRDFRVYPARDEVVTLVVRQDHPMAGRQNVSLSDLTGYEWVIQERGSPIRRAVDGAFHANRLAMPPHITNSSSLLVALAILEKSDAISPQSREVAQLLTRDGLNARLSMLDIDQDIFVAPFFLIQLEGRKLSRIAEIVLETLLREI